MEKSHFRWTTFRGAGQPQFAVDNPDAEYYFHNNLEEALADVEREFTESIGNGWAPHNSATF